MAILLYKATMQYVLTCKVKRYCIEAFHGSIVIFDGPYIEPAVKNIQPTMFECLKQHFLDCSVALMLQCGSGSLLMGIDHSHVLALTARGSTLVVRIWRL